MNDNNHVSTPGTPALRPFQQRVSTPGTPVLRPFQQRVIDEHAELIEKLTRLTQFRTTPDFRRLKEHDRRLLNRQASTMSHYAEILEDRIAQFSIASDNLANTKT